MVYFSRKERRGEERRGKERRGRKTTKVAIIRINLYKTSVNFVNIKNDFNKKILCL